MDASTMTALALKPINVQPNSRYKLKVDVGNGNFGVNDSLIYGVVILNGNEYAEQSFMATPLEEQRVENFITPSDLFNTTTHTLNFITDATTNSIVLQIYIMLKDSTQNNLYFTINNITLEEVNGGEIYTINQHSSLNRYRFGFNGMEKQEELNPLPYDFGNRLYDPRRGQFPTTDKLASQFPWQSPYVFAASSPILYVDENGDKHTVHFYIRDASGKTTKITQENVRKVFFKVYKGYYGYNGISRDMEQSVIIDVQNGTLNFTKPIYTGSKQNYFKQKAKNIADKLRVTDENGRQPFGYNVRNPEGISSQAFEEIKGKAVIVEDLDISGMFPGLDKDGLLDLLGKMKGVNKSMKEAAELFEKILEGSNKVVDVAVEVKEQIEKNKKPLSVTGEEQLKIVEKKYIINKKTYSDGSSKEDTLDYKGKTQDGNGNRYGMGRQSKRDVENGVYPAK